jgi:CRISPR system Cascade subunit CasE
MHGAVEACFPNSPKGDERKLWRVDRLDEVLYLLLLSRNKPDFTSFAEQFCASEQQDEIKPYDNLLGRVQAEQMWRFRLQANPVHSVKNAKNTPDRGKVYAHVAVEHQQNWLRKKAPLCGFAIVKDEKDQELFDVIQSEHLRFKRQNENVTLGIATFEGVLRVTEEEKFVKALTEGIGRAKAYGCGLLTIARLA